MYYNDKIMKCTPAVGRGACYYRKKDTMSATRKHYFARLAGRCLILVCALPLFENIMGALIAFLQ